MVQVSSVGLPASKPISRVGEAWTNIFPAEHGEEVLHEADDAPEREADDAPDHVQHAEFGTTLHTLVFALALLTQTEEFSNVEADFCLTVAVIIIIITIIVVTMLVVIMLLLLLLLLLVLLLLLSPVVSEIIKS